MADVAHRSQHTQRDQLVFAIVLIVIGVIGLITQVVQPSGDVGGWIVMVIGLGFAAGYLYTRQYGYLVPGGIMTGLGAGIVVSQTFKWTTSEGEGGAVVLGLGLGFVAIWVVGMLIEGARDRVWPLIPGGILSIVGAALLIGREAVDLLDYWGVIVIAIGLLLLWRAWTTSQTKG